MSKINRKYTESFKDVNFEDEYEDYGYDVQNAKRYSVRNKRQAKFKDHDDTFIDYWVVRPCATIWSGTQDLVEGSGDGIVHESSGNPMKDIRIFVETWDGCITIWYERSKLKNATDVICQRVNNQLCGLNLKKVEVSVIGGTV